MLGFAWISLDSLVRIGTFQRVKANPNEKIIVVNIDRVYRVICARGRQTCRFRLRPSSLGLTLAIALPLTRGTLAQPSIFQKKLFAHLASAVGHQKIQPTRSVNVRRPPQQMCELPISCPSVIVRLRAHLWLSPLSLRRAFLLPRAGAPRTRGFSFRRRLGPVDLSASSGMAAHARMFGRSPRSLSRQVAPLPRPAPPPLGGRSADDRPPEALTTFA